MRWIVFTIIVVLAGLFLWPIVLKMGRKVGKKFDEIQEEDKDDSAE